MDRRRKRKQKSCLPMENELLKNPPKLGSWDDPLGYDGRTPSETLLTEVRYAVFEGREQWYHRRAQLVDGQILAGEDSHKIVKSIRVADSKVYHGVHTMLNEFGQVVMQVGACLFLSCSCKHVHSCRVRNGSTTSGVHHIRHSPYASPPSCHLFNCFVLSISSAPR